MESSRQPAKGPGDAHRRESLRASRGTAPTRRILGIPGVGDKTSRAPVFIMKIGRLSSRADGLEQSRNPGCQSAVSTRACRKARTRTPRQARPSAVGLPSSSCPSTNTRVRPRSSAIRALCVTTIRAVPRVRLISSRRLGHVRAGSRVQVTRGFVGQEDRRLKN